MNLRLTRSSRSPAITFFSASASMAGAASIPVTSAPRAAIMSVSVPVPQPISSTRVPGRMYSSAIFSLIRWILPSVSS